VLECQVEAASAALTDIAIDVPAEAVIDRLTLLEGAGAGAAPVDLVSSRPEPERLTVVVQQPRTGRFSLRVEARLPGRPAAEGRMPLARCASGGGSPLVVTWRSAAGIDVRVPDAAATRLGVGATAAADAGERREVLPGDEGPEYALAEMAAADAAAAGPPAVGLPPSAAAAPLGNEVVATTVQLAIDRRGRARGSVRFDLVAAAPLVRLRMPAGLRLVDLLVDGRETQAVPQVDDAWELRLHDIRWPRSIVAVFAGDVGGRPEDGTAIHLEPPLLEGLPCREVLWMIDAPTGMRLRVAEPARIIDGIRWEAMQTDVRERLAGLFAVAVENAGDSERARLGAFAANRQAGDLPFVEAAWERAIAAPLPVGGDRVRVAVEGAAGVTIRAVRRADDTVPARGLVTVGLGVALALGWSLSGRWRPAWSAAFAMARPWAVAACGGAWVLFLEPAIPGWALLLTGAAAALSRLR
jgi:hypothetical protein